MDVRKLAYEYGVQLAKAEFAKHAAGTESDSKSEKPGWLDKVKKDAESRRHLRKEYTLRGLDALSSGVRQSS